ncbi:pyruvate carboxylase subunit B [Clostridium sp. Marseille-P2415]|uniref:pyruvate carboxylase subunit B n=1 Tax=Clostridium sp. Marseille-P2415 TaxID=1805471 RepID=UPI0009884B7B|nr:pyruvate carboxylase subunit B [Clostridium sp. Marseille-P2415]
MFWNRKTQIPAGIGAADFAGAGIPLKFNSVEFRDGQQSLIATRMTTEDMIPLLSRMDSVGYDSMEMWGGATFDVAVRFLKEDPWERVRTFKKYVKKTPLKMVLRAQNLVGYKAYPDDIVEKFVEKAALAGIDIFLIFDALQDLRNCESAFRAVKKAGKKIEGSVQYNVSPFHTTEVFVQNAMEQERMGASLMHVEDMAGLMAPKAAYELISALKKALKIPVHLHCHCTGGMAEMAYWEAIRAGVDGLDVCVSSMSMGPAHPPIESFVSALKGTSRDPGIDVGQFKSVNEDFISIRKKYSNFETKLIGVDVGCLEHQIPGGMLSNLESQLSAMKLYDRLPEVLEEVTRVRADMGYPPLATPSSQMCGAQATTNVLTGNRYSMVSKEIKDYCRGMYGMPPGPVDPVLLEKALGEEKPSTKKPADLLEPGFEKAKAEAGGLVRTEEDILTYALFPNYAPDFLKAKYGL